MRFFSADLPEDPAALETVIKEHEKAALPLKNNAEARIKWHNEHQKNKTPFTVIYLHGFKGSQGEGYPVHTTIAQTFGCNLYLSRLYGHGLKRSQNLEKITAGDLIRSALDACRIGQKIGDRLILMGTSTGALLALYAAASQEFSDSVEALVLYSPLVHLYGINSVLLENRIGRGLLRIFPGKDYRLTLDPFSPEEEAIWYPAYRLNGALALGATIQKLSWQELFTRVTARTFIGYYYKNRREHDRVVSTSAIKRMARKLGTPPSQVTLKNFPGAGSHVICSPLLSGAVQDVIRETSSFLSRNAGLSHQR